MRIRCVQAWLQTHAEKHRYRAALHEKQVQDKEDCRRCFMNGHIIGRNEAIGSKDRVHQ
jgi:hypothetical protein